MARKHMIRRDPLDIEPQPTDVDPRPLDLTEIRKKGLLSI